MDREKMIDKATEKILDTHLECVISRKEQGSRVCNECEYKDGNYCFLEKKIASEIINSIIPDGAVVLTREEAEEYQEYKRVLAEAESPRNAAFYRLGQKRRDEIRKETAREILKILDQHGVDKDILETCGLYDVNGVKLAKEICEKYGVEVE